MKKLLIIIPIFICVLLAYFFAFGFGDRSLYVFQLDDNSSDLRDYINPSQREERNFEDPMFDDEWSDDAGIGGLTLAYLYANPKDKEGGKTSRYDFAVQEIKTNRKLRGKTVNVISVTPIKPSGNFKIRYFLNSYKNLKGNCYTWGHKNPAAMNDLGGITGHGFMQPAAGSKFTIEAGCRWSLMTSFYLPRYKKHDIKSSGPYQTIGPWETAGVDIEYSEEGNNYRERIIFREGVREATVSPSIKLPN